MNRGRKRGTGGGLARGKNLFIVVFAYNMPVITHGYGQNIYSFVRRNSVVCVWAEWLKYGQLACQGRFLHKLGMPRLQRGFVFVFGGVSKLCKLGYVVNVVENKINTLSVRVRAIMRKSARQMGKFDPNSRRMPHMQKCNFIKCPKRHNNAKNSAQITNYLP